MPPVEAQAELVQEQQSAPREQLSERQQEPRQLRLRSSATTSPARPAAAPTSPASSSGNGGSSSRPSLARQHRCFNTAVQAPSLDASVSTAAVARSLGLQYAVMGNLTVAPGSGSEDDSGPHADADSSSVASSGDEEGGQVGTS
jgi:hypothetical protein